MRVPRRRRQLTARRAEGGAEARGARLARRSAAGCARRPAQRAPAPGGRRRHRSRDAGAVRAAVARRHPRRRHHGGGDGERLSDPGALDDVHRGCVRVLRRKGAVRRGRAGPDGTAVRRHPDGDCLRDRAPRAAEHLRPRGAVRVFRVLGAVAAPPGRALLEAKHQVGRARGHGVGGRRGDLYRAHAGRARMVRPDARRSHDADLVRVDARRLADDAASVARDRAEVHRGMTGSGAILTGRGLTRPPCRSPPRRRHRRDEG